jgi:hypothetical protein
MKSFYFLLLFTVGLVSCRTKTGEPGPSGASVLNQQGSVSGMITYSMNNGTTTMDSVPFKYIYFKSLDDNKFYFDNSNGDYQVSFERRDSKDNNNYFDLDCYGSGTNGVEEDPSYSSVDFSFLTVINNQLFEFSDSNNGTITNLTLDPATGRLTFNYTDDDVEFDNGTASITLKVDVILNRSGHGILAL